MLKQEYCHELWRVLVTVQPFHQCNFLPTITTVSNDMGGIPLSPAVLICKLKLQDSRNHSPVPLTLDLVWVSPCQARTAQSGLKHLLLPREKEGVGMSWTTEIHLECGFSPKVAFVSALVSLLSPKKLPRDQQEEKKEGVFQEAGKS